MERTNKLQKCGHASLIETQNGEWYLAHLTGRPLAFDKYPIREREQHAYCPLGRETAIQKITWENGWPVVVGGKAGLACFKLNRQAGVIFGAIVTGAVIVFGGTKVVEKRRVSIHDHFAGIEVELQKT